MGRIGGYLRLLALLLSWLLVCDAPAWAAQSAARARASRSSGSQKKTSTKKARSSVPTYVDPTQDDIAEYDDAVVREIAVEALGRRNGSVVAVDPNSGRILSIVNQRLAFSAGFQPCSTIKPVIALAALEEGLLTRDALLPVGRRRYMNLTDAMAHSNNKFFELLGKQLGFEKVVRYARLMGLGELAGYSIAEEYPGALPSEPPENGGVGRMSSFGEGILITPLQLASLVSTLANGGTMYYLQYPRSEPERQNFAARIKRQMNINALLPELREGMLAAVLYGTARSSFDPEGEQLLGKTGTCSGQGSRLGWFVSYADQVHPRIVLVVLLRGHSHRVNGPSAADIAGRIYQRLRERRFFATNRQDLSTRAGSDH